MTLCGAVGFLMLTLMVVYRRGKRRDTGGRNISLIASANSTFLTTDFLDVWGELDGVVFAYAWVAPLI